MRRHAPVISTRHGSTARSRRRPSLRRQVRFGSPMHGLTLPAQLFKRENSRKGNGNSWPRKAYAGLVTELLDRGDSDRALDAWERFRGAGTPPYDLEPAIKATFVVYAVLPGGVAVWVQRGRERHIAWLAPADDIRHNLVETFARQC